jgi:Ser/Thr protein kinase RdoA (MazF antagonist)
MIKEIFKKHNLDVLSYKKLGGYSNLNYKVQSHKNYFLKLHSNDYSIVKMKEVNEKLKELNMKIIPIIYFYGVHNKQFYTISEFVEGNKYNGTLIQLKESAQKLALFHVKSKKVKFNHFTEFDVYKFPFSKNKKIQGYITKFNSEYKQIKKTKQWIHRDYSPEQLIFKENKIIGLVDFDTIAYGPIEYDLVWACKNFSVTRKPYKFNLKRIRMFIGEYNKINKVKLNEGEVYLYLSHSLLKGAIYHSEGNKEIYKYFMDLLDDLNKRRNKIVIAYV